MKIYPESNFKYRETFGAAKSEGFREFDMDMDAMIISTAPLSLNLAEDLPCTIYLATCRFRESPSRINLYDHRLGL
jgi:hypothetical protein